MPADATSVAVAEESSASRLDAILGSDISQSSSPDSGQPGDQSNVGAPDDAASSQQSAAPEEFDESSILPIEQNVDFAESDYQRAAKHYSKQFGFEFNPQDPVHRSMLREYMDRGRTIAQQKQAQSQAEEVDDTPAEVEEEAPAAPQLNTPEEVSKFLSGVEEYAGKMVRPEVATRVAKNFVASVFGPKEAEKVSPEGAVKFTQSMYSMGLLMLNDALPQIVPNLVQNWVAQNYPMLADMHSSTLETNAVRALSKATANGQPRYPGLEKLMQDGTMEAVYAENPELRGGQFYDVNTGRPLSPLDNKKRELHVVYTMARGRAVNPALLQQVADTASQQATTRARTAGSGKLAAGESRGAFQTSSPEQDFLSNLIKGDDNSNRWEAEMARMRGKK